MLLLKGDFKAVERAHFVALLLQGLRIAVPAALLLMVPTETVQSILNAMPDWLKDGMAIGGWYGRCRWLRYGYQHDGNS